MIAPMAPRNEEADKQYDTLDWKDPMKSIIYHPFNKRNNHKLLVFGYVRQYERNNKLSTQFDIEISNIILYFFFVGIRTFGLYNTDKFECTHAETVIKSKGDDCSGYFIFDKCENDKYTNGYFEGIHYWTLKIHLTGCSHNCGLMRSSLGKPSELIQMNNFSITQDLPNSSLLHGGAKMPNDGIMSIILDCNNWIVWYFLQENGVHDEIQLIQKDKIKSNESYYFFLYLCAVSNCYQFVQTPDDLICNDDYQQYPKHIFFRKY
eukprot:280028_1